MSQSEPREHSSHLAHIIPVSIHYVAEVDVFNAWQLDLPEPCCRPEGSLPGSEAAANHIEARQKFALDTGKPEGPSALTYDAACLDKSPSLHCVLVRCNGKVRIAAGLL